MKIFFDIPEIALESMPPLNKHAIGKSERSLLFNDLTKVSFKIILESSKEVDRSIFTFLKFQKFFFTNFFSENRTIVFGSRLYISLKKVEFFKSMVLKPKFR